MKNIQENVTLIQMEIYLNDKLRIVILKVKRLKQLSGILKKNLGNTKASAKELGLIM